MGRHFLKNITNLPIPYRQCPRSSTRLPARRKPDLIASMVPQHATIVGEGANGIVQLVKNGDKVSVVKRLRDNDDLDALECFLQEIRILEQLSHRCAALSLGLAGSVFHIHLPCNLRTTSCLKISPVVMLRYTASRVPV